MVTYQVTAKVENHLSSEYEKYMRDLHIPDVLATGAFASATLQIADGGYYLISYEAVSREALDEYLNEHATRLRKDVIGRFPEGIELTRKEWETIQTWKC